MPPAATDPLDAYRLYSAAWAEFDPPAAAALLAECWFEDGKFFDPETPDGLVGREALAGYIASTHAEMPGLKISDLAEPEFLGGRLRATWVARQDDEEMFTGTDFVEFAADGRISHLTMFYDSTPD